MTEQLPEGQPFAWTAPSDPDSFTIREIVFDRGTVGDSDFDPRAREKYKRRERKLRARKKRLTLRLDKLEERDWERHDDGKRTGVKKRTWLRTKLHRVDVLLERRGVFHA